jgi:hypothetical protein
MLPVSGIAESLSAPYRLVQALDVVGLVAIAIALPGIAKLLRDDKR